MLLLLMRRWLALLQAAGRYYVRAGNWCACASTLALFHGAPISGLLPLAVVRRGCAGRWRERRGSSVAFPLDTALLEAWAAEAPDLAVVEVAVVAHECVCDDGADAEPDETRGSAEHPVAVVMVEPQVVVWHMMREK